MAQGLLHYLLHKLRGHMELHPALLNPRYSQEILHQVDEPYRILINIRIQPLLRLLIKLPAVGKKVAGIAGNRGERRSEIMGNGAEKVGAEPFILRCNCRLLLLPNILLILQRKGALPQKGQKNAGLKLIQSPLLGPNRHHPVHSRLIAYRYVHILCA